jgi:hypothetical protein
MPRLFRRVAAAVALALLLAGSAQAGPIGRRGSPPGPADLLDLVQGWLRALRTDLPGLSPAREEAGGIMDPDGRDGTASPPPGQDEGSIMDPDG